MELILQGLAGAVAKIVALDPDILDAAQTSLVVTGSATALSILIGVPLGALVGLTRFPGRTLTLSLTNTGMGLPPVVVGLFVVTFLWRSGPLGDLSWYCTRQAMVVAQFILAFPTVIGLTAIALQSLDPMLPLQVRALGATRGQVLWVLIREARLAIVTAAVAGFGAVISEIGASIMTGCNIKGDTRILTTAIVLEVDKGQFAAAYALAFILLALIFAVNAITTSVQQRQAAA